MGMGIAITARGSCWNSFRARKTSVNAPRSGGSGNRNRNVRTRGYTRWLNFAGNLPSEVASLAAEQLEKGLKGVDDVVVSDLAIREKV